MGNATRGTYGGAVSVDRPPHWHPTNLAPEEQHRWERATALGFGHTEPQDPWSVEQIEGLGRRAWVVEDRDTIVGTSADVTWQLTLPGGASTPVGAVIAVTTRATHRRRGVMSALLSAQLGAMAAEGLGAAVLTASEGTIYGRFGFGVAASQHRLVATTDGHGLGHVPLGRIDLDEASVFRDEIVAFRQCVARRRPGTLSRPDLWWDRLVLGKRLSFEGGGPQFVSVHRTGQGSVDGYALWRLEGEWGERTVVIRELHTLDPSVELALFRHCAEIDLAATVRWDTAPADSPVLAATTDPRNCRLAGTRDQLWLCPLNPAALLAGRTYSDAIDLVLEIGPMPGLGEAPERLRVSAQDGVHARVERTDAAAQIVCDRAAFGMAILGTVPWRTLAAAGRVDVIDPAVLPSVDAAFASYPAPNSQDYF